MYANGVRFIEVAINDSITHAREQFSGKLFTPKQNSSGSVLESKVFPFQSGTGLERK